MKYILVTGGAMSGIGKGVVTSSIGALLKACGCKVTAIKIDPYLNYDAGTFSPYEHGEVFVLNDGCEVDLDLGNYERFLDTNLSQKHNITTGKINQQINERERQGGYLGQTVRIIPHYTDAIQEWVENAAKIMQNDEVADVCLIELGGTIGDIEGMPFIKAMDELRWRLKDEDFCCCHVAPIISWGQSEELKTKPVQQSLEKLLSNGLRPDMMICRTQNPITEKIRDKISSFCRVHEAHVFNLTDLPTIYQAPIELQKQGMISAISKCLGIDLVCNNLSRWKEISDIACNAEHTITIALVGKYTNLKECYMSVEKALQHACYSIGAKPNVRYIESTALEENNAKAWILLKTSHCLIVPGGFGLRGVEGKILAIKWARENNVPFLGVCLGFQIAVIEYARNKLGVSNAHSAECQQELKAADVDIEPFVIEMLEYKDPENKMGGTMRLGLRKTVFVTDDSAIKMLYGNKEFIYERHRHRYEINPKHIDSLDKAGLKFVGKNEDGTRMEILEIKSHPYFVAVQFHPEFLSRPFKPSPPYLGLIQAGNSRAKQINGFECA